MKWLPEEGKIRTSLFLTVFAGSAARTRSRDSRLAYHFEGTGSPSLCQNQEAARRTIRARRNPIALAREWQDALHQGRCSSRAELARDLGISRARVTQVLGLLDLAPEVVEAVANLGDPLTERMVTDRMLRPLLTLPVDRHLDALRSMCPTIRNYPQR